MTATSPERIHWLIYEWRYSAVALMLTVAAIATGLLWLTGALQSSTYPYYFDSLRAFQGMLLMFILIPTYVSGCYIYGTRKTLQIAQTVDRNNDTNLAAAVSTYPTRFSAICAGAGVMYAIVFNIPGRGLNFFATDTVEQVTIIGQILIWMLLGGLLAQRAHLSIAFNRESNNVKTDLFNPHNLKPFAQVGLIDVLFIVGGLLISTVQSLDLSFRPDNYYKAIIIVVPALFYLVIYPMWGLHIRLKNLRLDELEKLAVLIDQTPRDLSLDNMRQLETLLQRQERVRKTSTWPIDIAIVQRFLFYIVIPPLAWVGAAIVELGIDAAISN